MICLALCLYSPQRESLNPQFVGSALLPPVPSGEGTSPSPACLLGDLAHLQKARLPVTLGEMSLTPGQKKRTKDLLFFKVCI